MSKLDILNKEFKDAGFEINDDTYILDRVTYTAVNMNGRIFQQPEHHKLKMKYIGICCELDDSDSEIEDTEIFEFQVYNGDEVAITLGISNFNDLKEAINV